MVVRAVRTLAWWVAGWLLLPGGSAFAQIIIPDDVPDRVVTPVPRTIAQALDEAETAIAAGQYHPAGKLLQSVLDNREDYFLDASCSSSSKRQALDLLRALPASGRQAYELEFGATAATLYELARATGDAAGLQDVARRYGLTRAAAEALQQLAARAFDSGDFLSAALLWEQLQSAQPGALSPIEQVQLAMAWDLAGNAAKAQRRLREVSVAAVKLRGQQVRLPSAPQSPEAWFASQLGPRWIGVAPALTDWPEARGGGARHESAQSTSPIGGALWRVPVIAGVSRDGGAQRFSEYGELAQQIDALAAQMTTDDRLVVPAASPIVAKNLAVFRSLEGLTAVDLLTGELRWRAVLSDPQLIRQRQNLQLLQQRNDAEQLPVYTTRLTALLREQLFRDATRGSLSTDGKCVFAVESSDPSLSGMSDAQRAMLRNVPNVPPPINKLVVYDLSGGRLVAEIGGRREEPALPFGGVFFFGPPLVHNGRLYCIAEANRELLLLQLRLTDEATPRFVLEWSQPLTAPERLLADAPLRRFAGLAPSVAGPLLICPTAAGMTAAVDLVQQQLRWGYKYDSLEAVRTLPPRQQFMARMPGRMPDFDEDSGRWLEGSPIIVGGRVLLTPRDSTELHCLDLLDGTLLWKRPRGSGLYVAGVANDRVVIVQRNSLEAFRMDNGKPAWPSPVVIPPPSGRGLLLDQRYVLPLSTGEIASVDLHEGRILARSRLLEGQLPGNLAASRGALVSQSLRDLLGFASEPEIETQIASRLAANSQDPRALSWRGELRLHRGELDTGLADLRAAQQVDPQPRTSGALAAALLQALRSDFAKYRAAAEELDHLTLDRPTRHEFLRLYAEALAREGRLREALQQYLRLAESAGEDPLWERVDEFLTARSDRVIQGRVQTLYQSASDAERRAMDAEIAGRLLTAEPSAEVDQRFLRYFGDHPGAAEVRRRVIERDLERDVPKANRLLLALASDPRDHQAGYATALLAQQLAKQPAAPFSRPWLKRLNDQFAETAMLDGQTGRELLSQWKVDRAELGSTAPDNWPAGEVDVAYTKKPLQSPRRLRLAETVGSLGPRFAGWSFEVWDDAEQALVARDGTGSAQWRSVVPPQPDDQQVRYASLRATPRVYAAGAWLALSLGTKFAVWEVAPQAGVDPKLCWQQSLTPPGLAGVASLQMQPEILPNGRRRLRSADVMGLDAPGQLIGVTPQNVVYYLSDRLYAADPATGVVQWLRQGVPRQFEATLDNDAIALLETTSGQARVYRVVDGVELARPRIGDPDDWLWFRGDRLLTLTRSGGLQHLGLSSLLAGERVWDYDDAFAQCRVIDDSEVLLLQPNGLLRCLALDTGRVRWEAKLPQLNAIECLWARRVDDRYELVIRQPVPASNGRRVIGFDYNQIEFSGIVAAVDGRAGKVLWSQEVGPTMFDPIQPARSPIIPFAARINSLPNAIRNDPAPLPGLTATFLDARTGDVLYDTKETAMPNLYQVELAGERRQIVVNFHAWTLEFHFGDKGH